jgi:hypothetical protein
MAIERFMRVRIEGRSPDVKDRERRISRAVADGIAATIRTKENPA